MVVEQRAARALERLARPARVQAHGGGAGRGRGRRFADLCQHLRGARQVGVRQGLAGGDHLGGDGAALRDRGPRHERAAGAGQPVVQEDAADARGGRGGRRRRALPEAGAGGLLRPRVELLAARRLRSAPQQALRQCAGRRAGHLRAHRQLRHRLRGRCQEHARPQLPGARREQGRGGAPAASRDQHRARRRAATR